ncbi:MAG: 23S rRNA (guanosine(2251)-2'-O)-methyltransferase RlmB [Pseudomonadota bacterium]
MENLVYGPHSVEVLLRERPANIAEMWVLEGAAARIQTLAQHARGAKIKVRAVSRQELDDLAQGGRHQGIVARLTQGASVCNEDALDELLERVADPFLLVLDGVQDPHNLGACLRTADAAGVHAVIVPKDRAVGLTPTVRKVASGAAETVLLIQVTNLARTLRHLKDRNVWIFGTADEAGESIYQVPLTGALAIVMGAEGDGLRRLTAEHCDRLMKIPMAGVVESLNVSVAAGVCLFEAVRQRARHT